MTSQGIENAANSVAVAILHDLACDGFGVKLTPDDAIVITPGSGLTPQRRQQIVEHKAAIKSLLRRSDAGVQDRRDVFAMQLEMTLPGVVMPRLVFRETAYVKGRCHACGEALERLRWGSCWRCSLARRLACGAVIPSDLLTAYNEARICT